MTIHLNSQSDLEDAIHALLKQDKRLKPIFEVTGIFERLDPDWV